MTIVWHFKIRKKKTKYRDNYQTIIKLTILYFPFIYCILNSMLIKTKFKLNFFFYLLKSNTFWNSRCQSDDNSNAVCASRSKTRGSNFKLFMSPQWWGRRKFCTVRILRSFVLRLKKQLPILETNFLSWQHILM